MPLLPRMQFSILFQSGQVLNTLLAELQSEQELFASGNTLAAVEAHLLVMAQTLAHLPPAMQRRLVHADWHGWGRLQQQLEQSALPRHEAVWYGLKSLAPATLQLLIDLQRREPGWFDLDY